MRYGEFLARYKRAYEAWSVGDLDTVGATEEIDRLHKLVPSIEEPDRHAFAAGQLAQWTRRLSPAAQDRIARATSVLAEAGTDHGTPADRLARAQHGLLALTALADETEDDGERTAILAMTEPLSLLIDALEANLAPETNG